MCAYEVESLSVKIKAITNLNKASRLKNLWSLDKNNPITSLKQKYDNSCLSYAFLNDFIGQKLFKRIVYLSFIEDFLILVQNYTVVQKEIFGCVGIYFFKF